MISDPDRTTVLSSMGWVEADAIWRYDVAGGRPETIPLGSGARYLSLRGGDSDRFTVVPHLDGRRFEISVRRFESPTEVLAQATLDETGGRFTGDASVWKGFSRIYIEYLGFGGWNDYVLVRLLPTVDRIEVHRLPWYDERYDKGYQAVIDAVELPGEGLALVSVQRSSKLVLHDLETDEQKGTVETGGQAGNPQLELRRGGEEIWTIDYDTLVRIRAADRRVLRRKRLQGAAMGTGLFVGEWSFTPDEELCVVARPYSGDVVGVDPGSFQVKCTAKLGQQPLAVMALAGSEVIARDWKTGALLRGTLERRRWFG